MVPVVCGVCCGLLLVAVVVGGGAVKKEKKKKRKKRLLWQFFPRFRGTLLEFFVRHPMDVHAHQTPHFSIF